MPTNSLNHPIQVGGTVTGEHGVGLGKVGLLEEQFGEDGVGVMRNIKRALDPRFVHSLEIHIQNPYPYTKYPGTFSTLEKL